MSDQPNTTIQPLAEQGMRHGTNCFCPTCGYPGQLDTHEASNMAFSNSIWFNPIAKLWECWECGLK